MRSNGRQPAGRTRRSVTVRYQRVRYGYAVVVGGRQPRPFGEDLGPSAPASVIALPRWRPRADVTQTPTSIVVTIELAGVDPDDVEPMLYEDALVISGQRRLPGPGSGGVYHAAEIHQGSFRLELALPAPVAAERSEARYDRGLLVVTLVRADAEGGGDGR